QRIIVDEAQNMKNIDTEIFKSMMKLQAPIRWVLSGTPVHGISTLELFAYAQFLRCPGNYANKKWWMKKRNGEGIACFRQHLILGRKQKQVNSELNLPPLIEKMVNVELLAHEQKELKTMESQGL